MSVVANHIEDYRGRVITSGTPAELIAWVKGYCFHGGTARLVSATPVVYRLGYVPDHSPGSM